MFPEPVGPEKSAPSAAPAELAPERNDVLFNKIAAVWLWSIFFGLNTGVSASYINSFGNALSSTLLQGMFGGGRGMDPNASNPFGEMLSFAIPFSYLGGILATLGSWFFLYSFFSRILLPTVFESLATTTAARSRAASRLLRSVYFWVIAAGVLRYIPEFLMHLAPVINRVSNQGGAPMMAPFLR